VADGDSTKIVCVDATTGSLIDSISIRGGVTTALSSSGGTQVPFDTDPSAAEYDWRVYFADSENNIYAVRVLRGGNGVLRIENPIDSASASSYLRTAFVGEIYGIGGSVSATGGASGTAYAYVFTDRGLFMLEENPATTSTWRTPIAAAPSDFAAPNADDSEKAYRVPAILVGDDGIPDAVFATSHGTAPSGTAKLFGLDGLSMTELKGELWPSSWDWPAVQGCSDGVPEIPDGYFSFGVIEGTGTEATAVPLRELIVVPTSTSEAYIIVATESNAYAFYFPEGHFRE